MNILVVNAGSSSLKYQLIDTDTDTLYAKGICERIGGEGSLIEHKQILKGIKAGRAIEYQQYFVWSVGHDFLHDVLDFGQLVHQVNLVMKTSGGIDDDYIGVVGGGRT